MRRWLVETLRDQAEGDALLTVAIVVMWTLLAICGMGVVAASAFGAWVLLTVGWWGPPVLVAVLASAWFLAGLVVEAMREP